MKRTVRYAYLNARLFRPVFAALNADQSLPQPLEQALAQVDHEIGRLLSEANFQRAARYLASFAKNQMYEGGLQSFSKALWCYMKE